MVVYWGKEELAGKHIYVEGTTARLTDSEYGEHNAQFVRKQVLILVHPRQEMPRHPAPAIPADPAEHPLIVTNPAPTPHLHLLHVQPSAALTAHHLLNLPKTETKPIQTTEISPKEPMHIS